MNKWFSIVPPIFFALVRVGLLYGFFAVAAMYLSSQKGGIATLWYANAFAVAYLLTQPRSKFFGIFVTIAVANVTANLVMGNTPTLAFSFALPNILEIALAVILIQKTGVDVRFNESPQQLFRFLGVACALPPLLGATVGATTIASLGSTTFAAVWPAWYTSSTIGSIGLLPLALLVLRYGPQAFSACVGWRSTLVVAACSAAVSLLALLYLPFPFIYLTIPLMLAAVILSFEGAAITVWLSSLTSGVLIATGHFQPDQGTTGWGLLLLYIPILLTMISPLVLAASMKQGRQRERGRRVFEEALEKKNDELQTIIDHMPAMIGYWGADLKNRFGNRNYLDWFGLDREQLSNRHLRDVLGEETYQLNQSYIEGALKGQVQVFERMLVNQGGQARFTLAS